MKYFGILIVYKFFVLKDGRYENEEFVDLLMSDENFLDIKKYFFSWYNYYRWDFYVEFKVVGLNLLCNEISVKK